MLYFEKNPMLVLVIGILGVSCSAILIRYSVAPSTVTAAWRLLWTVILMTPITLGIGHNRKQLFATGKRELVLSCLSGLFLAAHFALWFESLQHTSVASSATIVCTEVIWVALGYWLVLKGKLSWKAVVSIVITVVGSVFIALSDSATGGLHLYGDILAFLASLAAAVYVLLGRVVRQTTTNTIYTYIVYSACAVTLTVLSLIQGNPLMGFGINPLIVGLGLAVFSTILGHSILSWCLKYFSPAFISAAKLCEPVVAAILAGFLFGEIPTSLQLFGGALILGGVYIYSRIERTQGG